MRHHVPHKQTQTISPRQKHTPHTHTTHTHAHTYSFIHLFPVIYPSFHGFISQWGPIHVQLLVSMCPYRTSIFSIRKHIISSLHHSFISSSHSLRGLPLLV